MYLFRKKPAKKFGRRMWNKKAIMGVSTLIIFITAILTAAVSASVIIRTVGILQERAGAVATDSRNMLVTRVEFISVSTYNNLTTESAYGADMIMKVGAGSYAYGLDTAALLFTSDQGTFTAELQHSNNEDYEYIISSVGNVTEIDIPDMDDDKLTETMIVVTNPGNNSMLKFEFSKDGVIAYADLGVDLDNTTNPNNFSIEDEPIIGEDGNWYGFIQLNGSTTTQTIAEPNAYLNITHYPVRDYCSLETLIPDKAFCFEVMQGNTDTAISKGEVMRIYYRMRDVNNLNPDEDFKFQMIPKNGGTTEVVGKMPDSLIRTTGQVWPTSLSS